MTFCLSVSTTISEKTIRYAPSMRFVAELDLKALGFDGADPAITGRPSYHPAVLRRTYVYGYPNHTPSNRRLERDAQRKIELMWLTGRLAPDFKTIADFRTANGSGCKTCAAGS